MSAHVRDPYVRQARDSGYRSRAAYKLIEIVEKDRLLRRGMTIVDLGAAPGSWSQVLAERVGPSGRIIAVDLSEMAPIPGVVFIQGDFREDEVLERIETALGGARCDLVLSDLSPNLTGVSDADQARSLHLCELALDFARKHLKQRGTLLVKAFQGTDYREFLASMRESFDTVLSRKPGASRDRSSEMYLLGKNPRMGAEGDFEAAKAP